MTCAEFLDRYTDFRDGLITASRELRRFERHLACCPACRRYDAAVRRGVRALQTVETIEPSPEFRRFVAAALALLALEGVHRPPVARAPVLPPVPFPKPVAHAGVPFVSFQDPRASVVTGNPSPYGTALVEPASAGR